MLLIIPIIYVLKWFFFFFESPQFHCHLPDSYWIFLQDVVETYNIEAIPYLSVHEGWREGRYHRY